MCVCECVCECVCVCVCALFPFLFVFDFCVFVCNVLQVTILISDDGQPPKQTRVTVTVVVPRDLFPPTFNLPANRSIDERAISGSLIYDMTVGDNDRQVRVAERKEESGLRDEERERS